MTVGQYLMQKYPIGVSERIAGEIDKAVRRAVVIGFVLGLFVGVFANLLVKLTT